MNKRKKNDKYKGFALFVFKWGSKVFNVVDLKSTLK